MFVVLDKIQVARTCSAREGDGVMGLADVRIERNWSRCLPLSATSVTRRVDRLSRPAMGHHGAYAKHRFAMLARPRLGGCGQEAVGGVRAPGAPRCQTECR
jgi:hypothetical protein